MRATARRHGRTVLAELRGESPLLLRQVPTPGDGVTVYSRRRGGRSARR